MPPRIICLNKILIRWRIFAWWNETLSCNPELRDDRRRHEHPAQALPLQRGSRQEGVVRRNGFAQKQGKVATKTGFWKTIFLIFNDCFQMKQLQHSHVVSTCKIKLWGNTFNFPIANNLKCTRLCGLDYSDFQFKSNQTF